MSDMKPTQGDWGWFAGLVDGDGCISIQKANGRYRASIIVVNKKPQNILKLMRLFGGNLDKVSRTSASSYVNGHYYRWVVSATKEVLECLRNSMPHMAEKKEKAKLAVELCEVQVAYRSLHTYKRPAETDAKMELLYQSAMVETNAVSECDVKAIRKERPIQGLDRVGDTQE